MRNLQENAIILKWMETISSPPIACMRALAMIQWLPERGGGIKERAITHQRRIPSIFPIRIVYLDFHIAFQLHIGLHPNGAQDPQPFSECKLEEAILHPSRCSDTGVQFSLVVF